MTSEPFRCAYRDDVAALAMGGLDPREAAAVERHLTDCVSCRRDHRHSREVLAVLDAALPGSGDRAAAGDAALEPGLEQATLARMLGEDVAVRRRRSPLALFLGGVAAALVLVATPLAVLLVRSHEAPPVLQLSGTGVAPDAWGEATLVPRTHGTLIDFEAGDLPTGPGSYVVTVRSGGTQVASEVFTVDADGWGTAVMRTDLPASAPYDVVVRPAEPGHGSSPVLQEQRSS